MYAALEVTAGPHTGRKIALSPGVPVRIGRTTKSDYVVAEDTFLSSAHFSVEWTGQHCVVRDLNSSNGTFLNGTRMAESPVLEGDIITAGQSSFALRLNPTEELAAVLPVATFDETRSMALPPPKAPPLPVNAPPLPASAPPLPVSAPVVPLSAPPVPVSAPAPPFGTTLTPSGRGLLDLLRGLADPVFAVLDRSAAASFVDAVESNGGAVEVLSETTGACLTIVNPESPLAAQLAVDVWGKGWGIYVTSHQQLNIVRNHLRRFQSLLTQDGAEFQFRFFNPNLLRSFLPTLSGDEAKTLFGPISAILAEGATADELVLFMPGPAGVLEKTLPLTEPRPQGSVHSAP